MNSTCATGAKEITANTGHAWLAGVAVTHAGQDPHLSDWLYCHPDELRFGPAPHSLRCLVDADTAHAAEPGKIKHAGGTWFPPPARRKTVQEVVATWRWRQRILRRDADKYRKGSFTDE